IGGCFMLTRVVLCIGSFFLIVGCQQDNREQALDEQKADHRLIQVENTDQENEQSVTNEEISDHLASIAKSVPDVNDAISIVAGPKFLRLLQTAHFLDQCFPLVKNDDLLSVHRGLVLCYLVGSQRLRRNFLYITPLGLT